MVDNKVSKLVKQYNERENLSALDKIKAARLEVDRATKILSDEAENAIRDALMEVFANIDVETVQWAQKSSEYNDEGMYPGIAGPILNHPEDENAAWLYGDSVAVPAKLTELNTVLNCIGTDLLADIFGDENVVTVRRSPNGIELESEYCGY